MLEVFHGVKSPLSISDDNWSRATLDFGFVVDDFASDFVVGDDVVVTEVLESATVEGETFGKFFVVN